MGKRRKHREGRREICPRCGAPIDTYSVESRGNRKYVYAIHYEYVNGKRRARKCYLGPVDSYEYVTRTHADLGIMFRGAHDRHRLIDYLDSLVRALNHLDPEEVNPRTLEHIADTLYRISVKLKQIARRRRK